jgi:hypothetical protein
MASGQHRQGRSFRLQLLKRTPLAHESDTVVRMIVSGRACEAGRRLLPSLGQGWCPPPCSPRRLQGITSRVMCYVRQPVAVLWRMCCANCCRCQVLRLVNLTLCRLAKDPLAWVPRRQDWARTRC